MAETTEALCDCGLGKNAPWHNGRARDPKANHEFRPVDSRADDAQKRAPGEHAIALTAEAASFLNDLEEHPLDPPREIKAVHFGENPRFDDAQKPVESLPALLARVEHNLTLRHVYPHEESRAEIAGLAARLRALSGAVSETYCVSCDHPACGALFEVAFQPRSDVTLYCPKHAGAVPTYDDIQRALTPFVNHWHRPDAVRAILAILPVAGVPPEQGEIAVVVPSRVLAADSTITEETPHG